MIGGMQASLYTVFVIGSRELTDTNSAAESVVQSMLTTVMGANAQIDANITTDEADGITFVSIDAIVLATSLPAIITSGCCSQYEAALRHSLGNPGKTPPLQQYRSEPVRRRTKTLVWACKLFIIIPVVLQTLSLISRLRMAM